MSRLCLALGFAGLLAAQTPAVVAIRNAKIVPVSGAVIEKGTVVVRNGLIAEVGANVSPPADAWVMEAEGLTVYPGLIDALGSIGIPEVLRPLPGAASGSPTPPPQSRGPEDRPLTNSWVRAADLIRTNERRIEIARAAGYTTSVTFPSSGIFAGQGAVVNLGGDNAGRMVIDARAGQLLTLARGGFAFFPGSLMGTIAYIRQVMLDADHYQKAKQLYEAKPQGLTRPAYDRALEGVIDSPRILLPAVSQVEIDRMTKFATEWKRPAVLYGAHDGYRAAGLIAKSGLPALVSLKWPEAPRDADPDEQESIRVLELRENAPSTPAVLAKSGVKFAFYSDGAESVHRSIRRAIDKGLTPEQALRAATLSAAEIFGVADRIGSIEPGKIANLVLVKGDLFTDRPQIQHVFVDGVRYEPPPPTPPAKPEATQ